MPTYDAGDAAIHIRPSLRGFNAELEAALKKIDAKLGVEVHPNLAQATADIARWRAQEQSRAVDINVDAHANIAQAAADLRRWRAQEQTRGIDVYAHADTAPATAEMAAWRAAEQARAVDVPVRVEPNAAARARRDLDRVADSAGKAKSALIWNAAALGVSTLPMLATGLVEVAGALQQITQAALVVPGAMAGAVASIGTLALGVHGVKDAYSALSSSAESAGGKQARSASSAARAQRDLASAYRDARRELEDLNLSLRGDQLSEEQAVLNAQKARRDLQRDLATGQISDQLDLQSRLLDIQQADQSAAEAHLRAVRKSQDVTAANAKGIEGSDRVVDAHDAVAAAAESMGGAADKAAEAMAKLSSNAQAFVTTMIELRPIFGELRNTVQDNLFADLSTSLRTLVEADLPLLKSGLGGIATAWNTNLKQLATSLGSDTSKGLLDRILGNTANAQTRFSKAIDPLVKGLMNLSAAGTDALPRMADGIGKAAERFSAFITAADTDGRLDKWINDGIDGMTQLGNTLINLGKIVNDLTTALGGEGLLSMLDNGSRKLHEFLSSADGQAKLKTFFAEARDELDKWRPILESLPGLFHGLMEGSQAWANVILPPLGKITGFLSDHPGLIKTVVEAFLAWKTIQGIDAVIVGLTNITGLLRGIPAAATTAAGIGGLGRLGAALLGPAGVVAGGGLLIYDYMSSQQDKQSAFDQAMAAASSPEEQEAIKRQFFGEKYVPPPPGAPGGPPAGSAPLPGTPAPAKPGTMLDQAAWEGLARDGDPVAQWVVAAKGKEDFEKRANWALANQDKDTPGFKPPESYAKGGPTPSGRGPGPTGGYLAEIHKSEYVANARGRAVLGDDFLAAANMGVVDIRRLPKFDIGGPGETLFDENGNPVSPGRAPGPAAAPFAPNPMSGSGGMGGILNSFISGVGGPLGNIAGLGGGMLGGPAGSSAGTAPMSLADRAAGIPGLIGLAGAAASSNPAAIDQWGQQTAQWLGGFTAKTLGGFGQALYQGALDIFGLGDSILSLKNPWTQAGMQVGQFALGNNGPIGKLMGGTTGGAAAGLGMPAGFGQQSITLGDGSTIQIPTFGTSQGVPNPGGSGTGSVSGAAFTAPSGKGAERWRPLVRQVLAAYGPRYGITNVSAWEDALVRQINTESGGNPDSVNPNDTDGRGGTQRVAGLLNFLKSTFDSHNVSGGAYMDPAAQIAAAISYTTSKWGVNPDGSPRQIGRGQGFARGGAARGPGGPRGDKIPAMLSDNEHVLDSDDVDAMGGQDAVYAFRRDLHGGALHRAWGGAITRALLPNAGQPSPGPAQAAAAKSITQPVPPGPSQIQPKVPPQTPALAPRPTPSPPPESAGADQGPDASERAGQLAAPEVGAAPTNLNHNLPALRMGIQSAASTIGNLAQSAIGAAPFPGAGEAGAMVAGLIKEGGKIVDDTANVFSSSLVGNLGDNTTSGAYGAPVLSQAPQPARNIDNRTIFGDVAVGDPREFVERQQLYQQQRSQAMVDYV